MNTSTVVKLEAGESEAVVSFDGVKIQDVRAYSPRMITMMNLEDAILLAHTILSFCDEPANADEMAIRRMELEQEARWDAISERV